MEKKPKRSGWICKCWKWLNKQNAISGFFVTVLGVWLAFVLAGLANRYSMNGATKKRLCHVYLESAYNVKIAEEILNRSNTYTVYSKRLHSDAVYAALQDDNIDSYIKYLY